MNPIKEQILKTCIIWTSMKDLCTATGCGRTTVLYHVKALIDMGQLEETTMGEFRTRKKLYKVINRGIGTRKEDAPKAQGASNTA